MVEQNLRRIRIRYTLKTTLGVAFLIAMLVLIYWLLFVFEVRNIVGIIAIAMFLIIPALQSLSTIPGEYRALKMMWSSNDPENLSKLLDYLREEGLM